jgi:hypothetical protein
MERLAVSLAALALSAPAFASPARVQALSGNRAFTDDTDVFLYPSVISEVGDAANVNYNASASGRKS